LVAHHLGGHGRDLYPRRPGAGAFLPLGSTSHAKGLRLNKSAGQGARARPMGRNQTNGRVGTRALSHDPTVKFGDVFVGGVKVEDPCRRRPTPATPPPPVGVLRPQGCPAGHPPPVWDEQRADVRHAGASGGPHLRLRRDDRRRPCGTRRRSSTRWFNPGDGRESPPPAHQRPATISGAREWRPSARQHAG